MTNQFTLNRRAAKLFTALQTNPSAFSASDAAALRMALDKVLKAIAKNLFDPVNGSAAKLAQAKTGEIVDALARHHFQHVVPK